MTFFSRTIAIVFCLISASGFAATGQLKPYKGNLQTPNFTLTDMQGTSHSLSDYRGKVVLLQFWATYCTPCRKEMPAMNNLIKKMTGKPFEIVTINMAEPKQAVEKFIQEVPVDFTVLLDEAGGTIGQWKVFAAPANFILDQQGNIVYTLYGATEWDSEQMVSDLSALIK